MIGSSLFDTFFDIEQPFISISINSGGLKRVTAPCVLGNKLPNIQFAKYHIWNNKSEGFPNMVLSTEIFNQSLRTEYSEAVNARYTFQPLWVSGISSTY